MSLQPHRYSVNCEVHISNETTSGVLNIIAYMDGDYQNPTFNEIHIAPVGFSRYTCYVERIYFYYRDGVYRNTVCHDDVPEEIRTIADNAREEIERDLIEYVSSLTFE